MTRSGQVNMADVARHAGVSTGTVSRALRNLPGVSDDTRRMIKQKADELSYVVSPEASRLSRGSTGRVALVVPRLHVWFYAAMVAALEHELRSADLDVLIYQVDGEVAAQPLLRRAARPPQGRRRGAGRAAGAQGRGRAPRHHGRRGGRRRRPDPRLPARRGRRPRHRPHRRPAPHRPRTPPDRDDPHQRQRGHLLVLRLRAHAGLPRPRWPTAGLPTVEPTTSWSSPTRRLRASAPCDGCWRWRHRPPPSSPTPTSSRSARCAPCRRRASPYPGRSPSSGSTATPPRELFGITSVDQSVAAQGRLAGRLVLDLLGRSAPGRGRPGRVPPRGARHDRAAPAGVTRPRPRDLSGRRRHSAGAHPIVPLEAEHAGPAPTARRGPRRRRCGPPRARHSGRAPTRGRCPARSCRGRSETSRPRSPRTATKDGMMSMVPPDTLVGVDLPGLALGVGVLEERVAAHRAPPASAYVSANERPARNLAGLRPASSSKVGARSMLLTN